MAMPSLKSLLNDHVFAGEHAPLSDITVKVEDGRLETEGDAPQRACLCPFQSEATVSIAPDGRLRLHAESSRVLGIPAKKLMEIFGLTLDDVVKIKDQRGVEIDGNDVLIDPGRVLPPPRIAGTARRASTWRTDGCSLRISSTCRKAEAEASLAPADTKAPPLCLLRGQRNPVRQAAHDRHGLAAHRR